MYWSPVIEPNFTCLLQSATNVLGHFAFSEFILLFVLFSYPDCPPPPFNYPLFNQCWYAELRLQHWNGDWEKNGVPYKINNDQGFQICHLTVRYVGTVSRTFVADCGLKEVNVFVLHGRMSVCYVSISTRFKHNISPVHELDLCFLLTSFTNRPPAVSLANRSRQK